MMTESYVKAGRGGAGNFYTKQELEIASKAATLHDIESQSNHQTINDLTRADITSNPPPEYLHTGRGGAGNWVQPKTLESKGFAQEESPNSTSTSSSLFGTKRVAGQSKPTYRGGRGGAGNYADYEAEEKARKEAEEKVRVDVERRVERDVEAGLARPPRAYGGPATAGQGAWEMADLA